MQWKVDMSTRSIFDLDQKLRPVHRWGDTCGVATSQPSGCWCPRRPSPRAGTTRRRSWRCSLWSSWYSWCAGLLITSTSSTPTTIPPSPPTLTSATSTSASTGWPCPTPASTPSSTTGSTRGSERTSTRSSAVCRAALGKGSKISPQ